MINALVTAVGNIGVGHQIVSALRLTPLPIKIYGTDICDFNIEKDVLDGFDIVPRASDIASYSSCINNIIERWKIDIIFVGSLPELLYFQKFRIQYEKAGIVLAINTDEATRICLNKYHTYQHLEKNQIPVPRFCKLNSINDCRKIDYFPVVLKPNGQLTSSEHVYIAFNESDLMCLCKYMLNQEIDIVAQEYIGNQYSEYTISVTTDLDGKVAGTIVICRDFSSAITYKNRYKYKNDEYYISSGITQGKIVHNDEISRQACIIANALRSRGSLNIQAMFVNNSLLIIEAHPAMTGSTYIKALAGYNEPEYYIQKRLLNEPFQLVFRDAFVKRDLVVSLTFTER